MTGQEFKTKAMDIGKKVKDTAVSIGKAAFEFGKNGIEWAVKNPEKAAGATAAAATVIGGATKLVRSVNRNVTMRRELHDKKYRVYDHSLGAFVYTKKPINRRMVDEIYAERRRTGKRVCEILADKGMLR